MRKNIYFLGAIVILISSCGGSGSNSDNNTNTPSGWEGTFNATGFPEISGRYAFLTKQFTYTCSDGTSGNVPAISLNLDVNQIDNTFTLTSPSTGTEPTPGITIIEATTTTGNVRKDATFLASKTATAQFDGISGTVTLAYSQDGIFNITRWNGNYSYSAYIADYDISCRYNTTFAGDKITSTTVAYLRAAQVKSKTTTSYNPREIVGYNALAIGFLR